MVDWVERSAKISVAAQLTLGIASLLGFTKINRPDGDAMFLTTLLVLDTVVQVIELIYYVIFIWQTRLDTAYRYIDWFLSTPVMLVSTAALLDYMRFPQLEVRDFAHVRRYDIGFIILMNALMLSFGLCHELGLIRKRYAIPLGFLPFVAVFAVLYARFSHGLPGNVALITSVCIVWALYGVAAWFPYNPKNIAYNFLDIVSKNFYGVIVAAILFFG